jgi:nicotinamide riboside kinase
MVKKVAIIGPESTGKSTLSARLAKHYNTLWVPEYARQYLSQHGTAYTYDALLEIAKGQVALEEEYLSKATQPPAPIEGLPNAKPASYGRRRLAAGEANTQHPTLLFIDTEMYVMKVWAEFVYGKCHQWIIDQVVARRYDLYLLCNTDIPWSPDVLREYPDPAPRQQLFCMYHDILVNQSTPWALISGDNEERLQSAINAVNAIL